MHHLPFLLLHSSVSLAFCLSVSWFYLPSWHVSGCHWFMLTSSPPPLKPTAPPSLHPSLRCPEASGAGAGLTVQEVLEGWPLPAVCSARVMFDDLTVHLKGKLVLSVRQTVFLWKVLFVHIFFLITEIYEETLVSIRHVIWMYSITAMTCLSFPLVLHFFQMSH